MVNMHRRRSNRTEVSWVIKYLLFGFNVLFWILGVAIFGIGIWAWQEKDTFNNLSRVAQIPFDPALILIIIGFVMYIIGFLGCIGALRENTSLLFVFCLCLTLIFLCQLAVGTLAFVYQSKLSDQINSQLNSMIVKYRDDIDLQNVIDWIQSDWLRCCGINDMGDWNKNEYFNCTKKDSRNANRVERCGVPFSCCKKNKDEMTNIQCGFGVRGVDGLNTHHEDIHEMGCVSAAKKWISRNLIPISAVIVGISLLQILGMCFAQNLRNDIFAQKAGWRD